MITEQQLSSAIVTLEQNIKDCREAKDKNKHDTEQIKKWSVQMLESKIKLQVLHYTEGLAAIISTEELQKDIIRLSGHLNKMKSPREMDLFIPEDEKKLIRKRHALELKLYALNFVAGTEKKII